MAINKLNKFNQTKIEAILKLENQFITNLFTILSLPQNIPKDEEDFEEEESPKKIPLPNGKTSRATSLVELQARISKFKDKNNTYKEKVQKRNLKNKLKKKIKREKRNLIQKKIRTKTKSKPDTQEIEENDNTKPVFNKDDKMVFSKIDFVGLGKKKKIKNERDPKKILEQVEQVNNKIKKLKEAGAVQKAAQIMEKSAWKNALAKAEGVKVKDDPVLLKKSIKKQEQKKRSSKKKWENRIEGVKHAKEEKQKKRTVNLEKRKKDKKLNKLKKASKKGKIIPGL